MTRLLIFGLGVWIAARVLTAIAKRLLLRVAAAPPPAAKSGTERRLMRDPTCGVFVAPSPALAVVEAGGTVYFCSAACRDRHRARRVS